MPAWFTIYTKVDCPICKEAIELLQVYGINYYEVDEEGFFEGIAPQVFREDDYIGGINELRSFLENEQKEKERSYRRGRRNQGSDQATGDKDSTG